MQDNGGQTDTIELSREKINTLEIHLEELSPLLDDEAKTFLANCDDDHLNIIFIGNRITRLEITSYWWSDGRGMVVGDFWADDTMDAVKKSAAEEAGVKYVNLAEIQDDPNYEAGMGTMVEGDDGKEHEIDPSGVAKHPGDTGMKWSAKKIVEAVCSL